MIKDIVIDNSVSYRFENPPDSTYKEFIEWLRTEGFLVLSQKLLIEIKQTTQGRKESSLPVIIDLLIRENRGIFIKKGELDTFVISKKIMKKLRSNKKDHDHIKIVLLSNRKLCLTEDVNLSYDINNYPGFKAKAADKPDLLDYKK
ncbi:MAG: hypothetical protein GY749_31630 [Desulfobacteraceae bacterium]|nr:hypothetical protein [Desulfobacteraceae bacterium]